MSNYNGQRDQRELAQLTVLLHLMLGAYVAPLTGNAQEQGLIERINHNGTVG